MEEKKLIGFCKALGEPTRIKLIKILSQKKMCVCELSAVLNMLQPRVSQHIRVLKEAGLLEEERQGYWMYYWLPRERLLENLKTLETFLRTDLTDIPEYRDIDCALNTLHDCRDGSTPQE